MNISELSNDQLLEEIKQKSRATDNWVARTKERLIKNPELRRQLESILKSKLK